MQGRGSGPRRHSARFRAPSGAPAPLSPPHSRRGNKRYAARRSGRFAPPRAFCLVSVIRGGGPSRLFAHLAALSPRGLCPRWPSARARAARRMPPPASPPALRPALRALPCVALRRDCPIRAVASGRSTRVCGLPLVALARLRAVPCSCARSPGPPGLFWAARLPAPGPSALRALIWPRPRGFWGLSPPLLRRGPPFSDRMGLVYASSRNQPPTNISFHLSITPATAGIGS